jgi:aspartate aminotransferase
MRCSKKMPRLNPRTLMIRESPTRKIDSLRERLAKEGKDIILLSAGQPGFPPPKELRERFAKELVEDESMRLYGYTPTAGIRELRELIAEDLKELGGPSLDPDQILLTAGGQAAMFSVLSSIIELDDKVVLFDPTYFGYQPLIEYLGGKVLWVPTIKEKGYQPDIERLKAILEDNKVKAVIVVTPDNPTGRTVKEEYVKALSDLAVDHDFWLIVDEAYKTLIFEGTHYWFYKYAPNNVVGIDVFSKDPGIPGWRLGFIYSNEDLVKRAKLVLQEVVYCPPSVAQYFVLTYLKDKKLKELVRGELWRKLKERRDTLIKAVEEFLPEAYMSRPEGGMFGFIDLGNYLKPLGIDGESFAKMLLEKKLVATVPGSYFGPTQKYTIRISFAVESPARIREGLKRIKELIEELQTRTPSSP